MSMMDFASDHLYCNEWTDPAEAETFLQRVVSIALLLPQGIIGGGVLLFYLFIGIPYWIIKGKWL